TSRSRLPRRIRLADRWSGRDFVGDSLGVWARKGPVGSHPTLPARRSERVDDQLRDSLRRLVGDEEDLSGQRDEAYVRTGLQDGPLVGSESTVAPLLGVYHPRRHARLAQPSGGVVVPMQPPEVLAQCSAKIACVVPREIRF